MQPAVLGFGGGVGDFCEGPIREGAEAGLENGLERVGEDFLPAFLTTLLPAFLATFQAALLDPLANGGAEHLILHDVDAHFLADPPFNFLFHS